MGFILCKECERWHHHHQQQQTWVAHLLHHCLWNNDIVESQAAICFQQVHLVQHYIGVEHKQLFTVWRC